MGFENQNIETPIDPDQFDEESAVVEGEEIKEEEILPETPEKPQEMDQETLESLEGVVEVPLANDEPDEEL